MTFNLLNKQACTNYTFKFGKYKGKTWNFVLKIDVDYLIWLMKQDFFKSDLEYLKTGKKIVRPPLDPGYNFI